MSTAHLTFRRGYDSLRITSNMSGSACIAPPHPQHADNVTTIWGHIPTQ
ncbi:MAG: hypothetical protein ACPHTB_01590 [Candidatus Puniceispirillaceae bacterium]